MKQFLSICTPDGDALGAFTQVALAQSPNVLDGAYVKETNLTKRVVPYPHLREADVMYKRRIWQEIDLRQKFNHTFYFPLDPIQDRKNLFDVIREALLVEGSLVAYSAGPLGEDDEFTFPLSADSIRTILNPVTLVKQYDDFGEVIGTVQQSNELSSDKITRYRIKEDWIWDRQRSERYVRILGIAPMMEDFDIDGNSVGFRPLFWLYYLPSAATSSPTARSTTCSTTPNAGRLRTCSKSATSRATLLKRTMRSTVRLSPTHVVWTPWLNPSASNKSCSTSSTTSGITDWDFPMNKGHRTWCPCFRPLRSNLHAHVAFAVGRGSLWGTHTV